MRPTRRALALFIAGFPAALLPAVVSPALWPAWPLYLGFAFALLAIDAVLAPAPGSVRRSLALPPVLVVGEEGRALLEVEIAGDFPRRGIEVRLDASAELTLEAPLRAERPAQGASRVEARVVARRRGTASVFALWLRWEGPLGLVCRVVRDERADRIAIVPDVLGARRRAVRWLERSAWESGAKPLAWSGEGSEFESMREHAAGMDPRAISWRASARHRRLLSHEFRAERNHQVVVAFDTGRMMAEPVEGRPRLDHAVEIGLRLAHVALRVGDRVGAYAFDEKPRGMVPPSGGARHAGALERFSSGLDYGTGETNFTLGLADLAARLRRRSFVVILTEFSDSITAELCVENAGLFARRHLVAFLALRDPALASALAREPRALDDVYRAVVAADLDRERDLVCRRLRRRGVFVLDAAPSQVAEPLLSRYLLAKRREMVG